MSYPAAVATGNAVIRAALALADAHVPTTSTFSRREIVDFLAAVDAHRTASARPHVQGPDIDIPP